MKMRSTTILENKFKMVQKLDGTITLSGSSPIAEYSVLEDTNVDSSIPISLTSQDSNMDHFIYYFIIIIYNK